MAARFLPLLACVLLAGGACAADLPDSHDLDALPRYPRAEIVDYLVSPSVERVYPLGPISRISGRLRMEGEVRALGQLTSLTYRLPDEEASQAAFAAARKALLKADATPLFWCEGRDCGSSSLLANAVFGNASLYGPDEQQAFLLVRLAAPQRDSLLAVYTITRGNRRAYLHAEQLDGAAPLGEWLPSAATLLRLLKDNGELTLSHVPAQPGGAWLDLLVRTLRLDTGVRVELAGSHAADWRAALSAQGVREARLELGGTTGEGLHLTWLR
ncbi:DUF4892 domain-containing protein [Pseudomonas panipatensis]|uniref:DUF4892 domain-containing protein n=1 Tax=Pseudomonas panipatensis TaxID=428992 RepID=A0A1G8F4E5_9PSED|nr:DUF4892 domain-containing protein [Pseudomonas panipatensis]SDH77013.1 protein of unknown function [Pseudomonas panipatensis]SMP55454.1 protein of unknown function [Pseudomonas panipatensis]